MDTISMETVRLVISVIGLCFIPIVVVIVGAFIKIVWSMISNYQTAQKEAHDKLEAKVERYKEDLDMEDSKIHGRVNNCEKTQASNYLDLTNSIHKVMELLQHMSGKLEASNKNKEL